MPKKIFYNNFAKIEILTRIWTNEFFSSSSSFAFKANTKSLTFVMINPFGDQLKPHSTLHAKFFVHVGEERKAL